MTAEKIATRSLALAVVTYGLGVVLALAGLSTTVSWAFLGVFSTLTLLGLVVPGVARGLRRVGRPKDPLVSEWEEIWRRPVR